MSRKRQPVCFHKPRRGIWNRSGHRCYGTHTKRGSVLPPTRHPSSPVRARLQHASRSARRLPSRCNRSCRGVRERRRQVTYPPLKGHVLRGCAAECNHLVSAGAELDRSVQHQVVAHIKRRSAPSRPTVAYGARALAASAGDDSSGERVSPASEAVGKQKATCGARDAAQNDCSQASGPANSRGSPALRSPGRFLAGPISCRSTLGGHRRHGGRLRASEIATALNGIPDEARASARLVRDLDRWYGRSIFA